MGVGVHRSMADVLTGRRVKWLVLVFWLLVAGVAGPLAGRLSDAERNDAKSWLPASAESTQVLDAQAAFLKSAKVVRSRPIGKGVTGALRLTLTDGRLTHDAAFQSVEQRASARDISQGNRRAGELLFADSYHYNIAAWEISKLLGLDHMMPVTIERWHNGSAGALSWWVDDVLMDHPAVAQIVTFAMPHDKLGEEVAAAVVLREGQSVTEQELRGFAATRP